ncbi:hypothetical protein [Singulisphaera sp. PoT]|uniref:hypothetical protein n=1 Tax=Singulisphaera sp. PoT TaxID=3411797 RepID=UPI003BF47795
MFDQVAVMIGNLGVDAIDCLVKRHAWRQIRDDGPSISGGHQDITARHEVCVLLDGADNLSLPHLSIFALHRLPQAFADSKAFIRQRVLNPPHKPVGVRRIDATLPRQFVDIGCGTVAKKGLKQEVQAITQRYRGHLKGRS